jgi:predicted small lipoprotein YifL
MRSGLNSEIVWGIVAILFMLLEGCGHKGPLKLPPPQVQPPQVQTTSPQTPDSQTPVSPFFQKIN